MVVLLETSPTYFLYSTLSEQHKTMHAEEGCQARDEDEGLQGLPLCDVYVCQWVD